MTERYQSQIKKDIDTEVVAVFFNYRLHHLVDYLKYNCLKLHPYVLFLTVFKRKWQKLHKKLASYQILSIVPLCGDAGWSSLVARRAHNPKVVGSNPAPATNSQHTQ